MSATKEQVDEAKKYLSLYINSTLCLEGAAQRINTLLNALTVAERERDEARSALAEYKRKARRDPCPNCTGPGPLTQPRTVLKC